MSVKIMAQHSWLNSSILPEYPQFHSFFPFDTCTKFIIHGTNRTIIFVLLKAHGCTLALAFSKKNDRWAQRFRPQRLQRARQIVMVQDSLCTRPISEVLNFSCHLM
jgi:hypothetical protein